MTLTFGAAGCKWHNWSQGSPLGALLYSGLAVALQAWLRSTVAGTSPFEERIVVTGHEVLYRLLKVNNLRADYCASLFDVAVMVSSTHCYSSCY